MEKIKSFFSLDIGLAKADQCKYLYLNLKTDKIVYVVTKQNRYLTLLLLLPDFDAASGK